jgi:hypothetical protein
MVVMAHAGGRRGTPPVLERPGNSETDSFTLTFWWDVWGVRGPRSSGISSHKITGSQWLSTCAKQHAARRLRIITIEWGEGTKRCEKETSN